jgi:glycosyltransferase involved in cell wall biosynthesis
MAISDSLPVISVVTPSYNQKNYLEETIRSVLLQGYPALEYIVIDGGSTDGSTEIIKKYSPWLSFWVSEPDAGQSDAISRGLKRATGQFATWINSDDLLCKDALTSHATRVGFDCNTVYVGYCIYIDHKSVPLSLHRGRVSCLEDLVSVNSVWRAKGNPGHIDQPAAVFPRQLFFSIGGVNVENHFTMDYELWGKFFLHGARFRYTEVIFGMFREHRAQKTHDMLRQTESLLMTAALLINSADFAQPKKNQLLADLDAYSNTYRKAHWRGTGRLAATGLPPAFVSLLRSLRARWRKSVGEQFPTP